MKNKIRLLGLFVGSMLVMGAVASSASAVNFTASEYPATVTAEAVGSYAYMIQGQQVNCATTHFEGTLNAASEELSLTPTYAGCVAFGFSNSKIDVNGCKFVMTIGNGTTGSTHITCPPGESIVITAAGGGHCTAKISPQTPTTNVFEYNDTGSDKVDIGFKEVKGVHTNVIKESFFCPLTTSATDTSGATTGSFTFSAIGGNTFDIG